MNNTLSARFKNAWNAFLSDNVGPKHGYFGGDAYRPDRTRTSHGRDLSMVAPMYNRIAIDASEIKIKHVKLDENGRYLYDMQSGLNNCLTMEANMDQTGQAFIQDIVMTMIDEGCVAVVPVDTSTDPYVTGSYDILTMRVGKIKEWFPEHIRVDLYNERTGKHEDVVVRKDVAAIIENPFYAVMNEPNGVLRRLTHKLALLDIIDEQSGSGKLDLIIQLPYSIKTDLRRDQAERRRKDIEHQLTGSKYGIAYTDGTEKITQLNRPVENNLMAQIEYLTSMLYSQLGITQTVMDGTADEKTMLNYYNRTIAPILNAIVFEFRRKFLTKTARTQHQSVEFFRDPFVLVPVSDLAEISDKFTRNEILSSNEIRQIVGMKPSDDPRADELRNKNLNAQNDQLPGQMTPEQEMVDNQGTPPGNAASSSLKTLMTKEQYEQQSAALSNLDDQLDSLEEELKPSSIKHYASPYYDPVKAHEYYMRNRELKGRKSTASLNEEGRSHAQYVKEQLTNERKQKTQAHKESVDKRIEGKKAWTDQSIERFREEMQAEIDSLRAKLKNMTPEQKDMYRDDIYGEIDKLRDDNTEKRMELRAEYSASSEMLRQGHREVSDKLKDLYDKIYLQELDKIKADPKFKKAPKQRKGSSRKGSNKGIIYY